MIPMKVVLHYRDPEGVDHERELGPFNQGVVIKKRDPTAPLSAYDVATDTAVARLWHSGWLVEEGDIPSNWITGGNAAVYYDNLFIQPYTPPQAQPRSMADMETQGDAEAYSRTLEALITARSFTVMLMTAMERRLRAAGEEFDHHTPDDPLERDSNAQITDEALSHVLLGAADRGLEAGELDRGVVAELDGSMTPLAMASRIEPGQVFLCLEHLESDGKCDCGLIPYVPRDEQDRLRAGLTALRDGNVFGYQSAEEMAAAILDGSWS